MAVKNKKRKIVIFGLVAFTIYVLISFVFINQDVKRTNDEVKNLQAKIDEKAIVNQQVQEMIENGVDQNYIIKMAREKLGFVFPNERVYIDISGK